jgi:hypothetical protein
VVIPEHWPKRAPPSLNFYDLRDSRAVEGGSERVDAGVDLTFEDSLVFADLIAHALRFGTSSKLLLGGVAAAETDS